MLRDCRTSNGISKARYTVKPNLIMVPHLGSVLSVVNATIVSRGRISCEQECGWRASIALGVQREWLNLLQKFSGHQAAPPREEKIVIWEQPLTSLPVICLNQPKPLALRESVCGAALYTRPRRKLVSAQRSRLFNYLHQPH